MFPPQAAFLDLYGGYDDLTDLLAELKRFDVDLDPQDCTQLERFTYIVWCIVSSAILLIGLLLFIRAQRGQMTPFRRMVRLTVVVPCMLYCPVMLGFVGACLDQQKTQEEGFCIALLVLEPLCVLQILRLLRDACRFGIGSRFFDLPLGKWEWRYLYYCIAFHSGIFTCALVMLSYVRGPGRLLLALEASLMLRLYRPHPTVCPAGELEMSVVLLGIAVLVAIGGHLTVDRATRYVPAFGRPTRRGQLAAREQLPPDEGPVIGSVKDLPLVSSLVALRRRRRLARREGAPEPQELTRAQLHAIDTQDFHQQCYRRAWLLGVTGPSAASACVIGGTLLTCFDTQQSQELPLYISLAAISFLAFLACLRGCRSPRSSASADPARWLYVGLAPFHAFVLGALGVCFVWLEAVGPLMERRFVELWDAEPQPTNALFIFFSLVLVQLLALYSIVIYDPNEAEAPVVTDDTPHGPLSADAVLLREDKASRRSGRLARTRAQLASTLAAVRRVARRDRRGRGGPHHAAGPWLGSTEGAAAPATANAALSGPSGIPPPPIRPRVRTEEEEAAAAAAVAAGMVPGPTAAAPAAASAGPAAPAAAPAGVELYGRRVRVGPSTTTDQQL